MRLHIEKKCFFIFTFFYYDCNSIILYARAYDHVCRQKNYLVLLKQVDCLRWSFVSPASACLLELLISTVQCYFLEESVINLCIFIPFFFWYHSYEDKVVLHIPGYPHKSLEYIINVILHMSLKWNHEFFIEAIWSWGSHSAHMFNSHFYFNNREGIFTDIFSSWFSMYKFSQYSSCFF